MIDELFEMIDKLFEFIEKILFIMALVGVGAYIYCVLVGLGILRWVF
jgi:hypothetical protein